jgi:protein-tyrosine phosphatase
MKIDLSSMHNLRDICDLKVGSNKQIKKGYLFRSGNLNKVSPSDIQIVENLHLDYIVDFRNELEFKEKADYVFDNVEYYNFPILDEDPEMLKRYNSNDTNLLTLLDDKIGGFNHMLKTYEEVAISPKSIKGYQEFFALLTKKPSRILWHCSQGKDRAGIASFLLEYALGVSIEDAKKDYLTTNEAMKLKIAELKPYVLKLFNNDENSLIQLDAVFTAKIEYLDKYLETIYKNYGTIDNYLENVLKVDIAKLREFYLE